jgi:hypothetical protein
MRLKNIGMLRRRSSERCWRRSLRLLGCDLPAERRCVRRLLWCYERCAGIEYVNDTFHCGTGKLVFEALLEILGVNDKFHS